MAKRAPHRRRRRRTAQCPGELGARAHPQRSHSPRPARTLRPLSRGDGRSLGRGAGSWHVSPTPSTDLDLRGDLMPRGAAVVRYEGKRGAVWRIKYRDAAGKQVLETLGPAPPWTERMAQRELGKRLAAVD